MVHKDTMLCKWNDFNLLHVSQNNDWSEYVCNSGNVRNSGGNTYVSNTANSGEKTSVTVGECPQQGGGGGMSATVGKLNMV